MNIEWSGRRFRDISRGATCERVDVDDTNVLVVVSDEAIEDGITDAEIVAIANAKIAAIGDTLPTEILVTTADMRAD